MFIVHETKIGQLVYSKRGYLLGSLPIQSLSASCSSRVIPTDTKAGKASITGHQHGLSGREMGHTGRFWDRSHSRNSIWFSKLQFLDTHQGSSLYLKTLRLTSHSLHHGTQHQARTRFHDNHFIASTDIPQCQHLG